MVTHNNYPSTPRLSKDDVVAELVRRANNYIQQGWSKFTVAADFTRAISHLNDVHKSRYDPLTVARYCN